MARVEEIQRYIIEGLSDRQIARTLRCRRSRVREIRASGETTTASATALARAPESAALPAWAHRVEWESVVSELGRGHEIKRIWEERAAHATGYPNFWKYLDRHYGWLLKQTVTLREFEPGSHCEVDWAGDRIPWWDVHGHRREAHVFVGILCHSQLIFACATSDERRTSWLSAHQKMFAFFGGVPRVVVPDNLKTGVSKAHLYDPDLNPAYMELARHYGVAVVPARAKRPRDKALVENAVGLVMRLYRWHSRDRRLHSLSEVNEALSQICQRLNHKTHTRFKTSRSARFEQLERTSMRPLPEQPFEEIEWRTATVHPDCTISVESVTYSVPHIHRGREVRVKLTARQLEVFAALERVALHPRDRSRSGARHVIHEHLPANSAAYREATPQNLLSQARFLSPALHNLLETLFREDALAHLRRAQGLIRHARSEISRSGRALGESRIAQAIEQMRRFDRVRVSYFEEQLRRLGQQKFAPPAVDREIQRVAGNPMLRGTAEPRGPGRTAPVDPAGQLPLPMEPERKATP